MTKYRICPNCRSKNPPNLLSCKYCGSDSLEYEKIIDDSLLVSPDNESVQPSEPQNVRNEAVRMVRVCDCGTRNPVNVRKCSKCGEDISVIRPVNELDLPAEQSQPQIKETLNKCTLNSLDGEFVFEIKEHITTVGREVSMSSYLSKKKYVSRRHAELLHESGRLYIKNLSSTNYTFVNNEKIESEKYIELHDGDELGMGGKLINNERQNDAAYFIVRIG